MKYFVLLFVIIISSCAIHKPMNQQRTFAFRLHPGQDLKKEILAFANLHHIEAGYIITCVGSLQEATIRLANQSTTNHWKQKFEIVSLVGTVSASGGSHLHISISDSTGNTIGGHLADGNIIYTTAEIVIGDAPHLKFNRTLDSITTYKELTVEER